MPLKTAHSDTPPHVYLTMWKYLINATHPNVHAKKEFVVSETADA